MPDWSTTGYQQSRSTFDNDMEDKKCVSFLLESLSQDLHSKRILDEQNKMLDPPWEKTGEQSLIYHPPGVIQYPELFKEAWEHITVGMYIIHKVIVQFATQLGNSSYIQSDQR